MWLQRIKQFFQRASRQEEAALDTNDSAEMPLTASRKDELAPFKQEDGCYYFKLKILRGATNRETGAYDQDVLRTESDLRGFHAVQRGGHPLMDVATITNAAKMSLSLNFDISDSRIYFSQTGCDELIDGKDKALGLCPDVEYGLIVLTEDDNAPTNIRRKTDVPEGTCPIIQPAFSNR